MAQSVDPILLDSTGQDIVTALNAIANKTVDSALSPTSVNPVQNKVITGEINGIKEKIPSGASSSNKMATANDITGVQNTVKANTKLIKDTVGFSGKNLLKNIFNSLTYADVTYTVNSDKSISTSGTATADMFNRIANFTVPKTGKYIASGVMGGSANTYLLFIRPDPADGTSWNITDGEVELNLDASKKYICNFVIYNGTNVDGLTVYPMLRNADILDSTYEPCHENVINTLREAEVIESNNLLQGEIVSTSGTGATWIRNKDGSIRVTGTNTTRANARIDCVLPAGSYIGSGCPLGGGSSTWQMNFQAQNPSVVNYFDNGEGVSFTLDEETTFKVFCNIEQTGSAIDKTFYPMIRVATEDGTYHPYYIPLKDSMFPRSEQVVLGAKNLLKNTVSTTTISGVTFIVNDDKSVTVNGTATSTINAFWIYQGDFKLNPNKEYILSGCPSGGSTETYNLSISSWTSGGPYANDIGNGIIIKGSDYQYSQYPSARCGIYIREGTTVDNLVFKPMIRLASDPDDTYVPYAMTNKELTENVVRKSITGLSFVSTYIDENNSEAAVTRCGFIAEINLKMVVTTQIPAYTKFAENVPKFHISGKSFSGFAFDNSDGNKGYRFYLDGAGTINNHASPIPIGTYYISLVYICRD